MLFKHVSVLHRVVLYFLLVIDSSAVTSFCLVEREALKLL